MHDGLGTVFMLEPHVLLAFFAYSSAGNAIVVG